jgi:alkane 1-monooxygenase
MPRSFYLLSFTLPSSVGIAFYLKGVFSYLPVFYSFIFLPALELILKENDQNLDSHDELLKKNDFFYDLILWAMVPIQLFLFFYFLFLMSSDLDIFSRIGIILSMGLSCGVLGINVAHELGHRNNSFEQGLARLLLSTSLYWHFFIEHNKGHHKNVSTPLDPESSRLNESLYHFWGRSITYSFLSAWKIDRGEMIKALLLQLFGLGLILYYFNSLTLLCFFSAAVFGILLLESVNYIEHYGLVRREISPGKYEKVLVKHSWNANHPLSRAILFDLSRHSDHHAYINRKYQLLRHHDDSPQLPTGYPGMILLSLIPPLWFRVMNRRLKEL